MLGCKVFLTYKRKRQNSVSVPKETPLTNSDLYNGLIDKSPSEDETINNSLHVCRDSTASPSTHKNIEFEESHEDCSKRDILPNKSCHSQVGSSLTVNADILGDNIHSEGITTASVGGVEPALERKSSFESCDTPSILKSSGERISNSLAKDEVTVLSTDSAEGTKFQAPLITFIRRCKRKRDVEGDDKTANKRSDMSICEGASEKGCVATDMKPSDTVFHVENKIPEVDFASASAISVQDSKTLTLSKEEPHDEPNRIELDINQATVCNEISLNNATKHTSSSGEEDKIAGGTPEKRSCGREESRAIVNHNVKATTEGSRPVFDLSVTPTDSSGTLECNVYLESNSQKQPVHAITETVLGSMDSTSRSHYAVYHQTFPPEMSNVRSAFVEEPSFKDSNKASHIPPFDFMSKDKCLQLFAEERTEGNFQSCMVPEERKYFQFEIENNPLKSSPPYLGLSLPTKPKTTRFASKKCFATFPFLSPIGETTQPFDENLLHQSSSSRCSSFLRHRSSRARALCERGIFQEQYFKPYASGWTEEELDSLWIGVRRYGRDNWNVMIRDPRLRFSPWRVVSDLAEQWEEEQRKLFQYQHSKPPQGISVGTVTGIDETRLSLGDVYNARRGRNVSRRARFKSAKNGPIIAHKPIRDPDPYLDYQGVSYGGNPVFGCPTNFMESKGSLPHWLREAVFLSPPLVPPAVTQQAGPKKETHGAFGGLRGKDLLTPGDVIVIESDVSSEETISDDRCARS